MIDIKAMRENPDAFKAKWDSRNENIDVQALLTLDKDWRSGTTKVEELKSQRKKASEEIGKVKKAGGDASEAMAAVKQIGEDIKALDAELIEIKNELDDKLMRLPNIPAETTPVGSSEDDNVEIRTWGTKEEFSFTPKAHWDIGEDLNIIDMPRGAKLSGSGFMLLRGGAARLERALLNFFLDHHAEHGYTEYMTPYMVSRKTMTGTGQLPKFEEDLYHSPTDDLFAIPTAEVPLTNIFAGEILEKDQLPMYLTAHTPCFRREAGAAGKDTRGIIRVHQFNKVEMVKLVEPEDSYTELETLVADAEHLLQKLGLHYRVLELCSADLGFSAAKCYDIEVWAPGVNRYLEISSCSNFEDFQARRAGLRYRPEKGAKPTFMHTLNGSGLALPRCVVALLETYQREDGSVAIPDALIPYMNGTVELRAEEI